MCLSNTLAYPYYNDFALWTQYKNPVKDIYVEKLFTDDAKETCMFHQSGRIALIQHSWIVELTIQYFWCEDDQQSI